MERIARLPARERSDLFSESATQKGTTPAVIEKDFWVTWVLNRLFQEPDLGRQLMFKGGTRNVSRKISIWSWTGVF